MVAKRRPIGHIKVRNGRQQASVEAPKVEGHRKRAYRTVATKREANQFISSKSTDVYSGAYVQPSDKTVGEAVTEYIALQAWGENQRRTAVSFSKRIVDSDLGRRPIQAVTPLELLQFLAGQRVSPRRDGRPGHLMDWSINHIIRLIRSTFKWGQENLILTRNASLVLKRKKKPAQKKMTIIDVRALEQVRSLAAGTPMEAPISIAGYGGLRRGEVIALRWREDVDIRSGRVWVQQGARTRRGGGVEYGPPKSDASIRSVLLPARARAWLRDFEARVRLANGGVLPEFVCEMPGGGAWLPQSFSNHFRRFLRHAKLRPMRFHDLRHSHVAHLIWVNIQMKVISVRVGHESIKITMDLYGHLLPGVEDDAMAQYDLKLTEYQLEEVSGM